VDEYAAALAEAVDEVLPSWVERSVTRLELAWRGDVPPDVAAAAAAAGQEARREIGARLRRLLETDIDEQWTGPLDVLRAAVAYPTAVLQAAGVPAVKRDEFAEHAFPDDLYDLTPATWSDVDERLHEPGLVWGAWKAKQFLDRRRAEGRR
jgi:hypothetical protein